MNATELLTDELIGAVFERRADRADAYDLGALRTAIVTTSAGTRQRRRWSLRPAGAQPVIAPRPVWVAIAVLAALLGLAIALVLIAQRPTTPFETGLLAFVRDGDVYLADPDGSNPEVVLHQDGTAFLTVAWSPDGSRLAVDGDSGAVVVDPATGDATYIGGTNPVWSPDGRELGVIDPFTGSADVTQLRIVDAATGSTSRTYPFPSVGGLAWSPNGRWIAGTGGTSGASNALARIDVTTGQWIELDGPSGMLDSERQPAWSPDSTHIAFIRWGSEGSPSCGDVPLCATDVFVANADGSDPIRLNRVPGKADQPAWSPDGRWIAYRAVDRSTVGGANWESIADAGSGIVRVHPDGTGERTIAADGAEAFTWTPGSDGLRFIASGSAGSAGTIREVSLDGVVHPVDARLGPAPNLFERTGARFGWQSLGTLGDVPALPSIAAPSVSPAPAAVITPPPAPPADPSGTWPTLATESDDGCRPMTLATDTGKVTTLANLCDDFFQHLDTWAWSPTGSVFAAVRGGTLTIVQRDGQVTMNVAHLTGLDSLGWAPDGAWLTAATSTKTWLLRADGSGLREIPGVATWSPDGRTLGVAAQEGGRLLVGGPDGSDLRAIGAFPSVMSWSPDGSRFAFVRDGDAWTASRDGLDLRSLMSLPVGGATNVAWSADGQWIAVAATHGFWLVRPDGGDRRWFGLGLGETVFDFHWASGAGTLAVETYTDATPDQQSLIYLVDPDGSPTVRLEDLTTPSWSPDGRFLAAEHAPANGGSDTRAVVLMNADGSGSHEFPGPAGSDPMVWVR